MQEKTEERVSSDTLPKRWHSLQEALPLGRSRGGECWGSCFSATRPKHTLGTTFPTNIPPSCLANAPIFLHCSSKKPLRGSAAHNHCWWTSGPWLPPLTLPLNRVRGREFSLCPSRIQAQNPEGPKRDLTGTSKRISFSAWATRAPRSAEKESMTQTMGRDTRGWSKAAESLGVFHLLRIVN